MVDVDALTENNSNSTKIVMVTMVKDQHQQHQEWQACFTDVTEFEQLLLNQDSNTAGRYRNKQQALSLAQYLLHENGAIDTNRLLLAKTFLQHHLYPD